MATEQGRRPIAAIRVGDRVLAWNETTGVTGFFAVTATFSHQDPTIVRLTLDGEMLLTTPEHPFFVEGTGWVPAEALQAGMRVRHGDGGFGLVHLRGWRPHPTHDRWGGRAVRNPTLF